jgi:hypothetical protein
MPSETIYSGSGLADVRVAWGSAGTGDVQVATLAASEDGDPTERLISVINDWLRDAGMQEINLKTLRELLPYRPEFDGWHASLSDWSGVNRLIKVLRRARDQAFGDPA